MSKPAGSKQAERRPDATLDIRGEVCPFTFIETKLKLEEMKSGEILEVILDHEPAVNDVPKSVESEGHEVLIVEEICEKTWRILIKKR
jgi:tRNA 2-thiouridine synthesizing protein A